MSRSMDHYTRAVYVISVAAELAGVHPQTLRIYERKGLVQPARTGGGARRYSQADIDRLHRIAQLTEAGLNLAGVEHVLRLERELDSARQEIEHHASRIEQLRRESATAIERARREQRRDVVPLRQEVSLYRR